MMTARSEVVRIALSYVGTPYAHQGRLPGVGLDCYGVIGCAYREAGIDLPMRSDYSASPSQPELYRWMDAHFDHVGLQDIQPADVLVFRMVVEAQHMAIVLSINPVVMVHAYRRVGAVVRHEFVPPWSGLLMSAHALKDGSWVE